jgi:hypothetical protein
MNKVIPALVLAVLIVSPVFAQKMTVKIVNRQDFETNYSYVVAGYSSSTSNANVNCSGDTTVNCNGSSTTTGYSTPARQVSFSVSGATFSLELPDGRLAVINCTSKFQERMAGASGNRRSCRVPLVDEIQAQFNGDKAKLEWPVSIDGKKNATETYKVLGVFPKQQPK